MATACAARSAVALPLASVAATTASSSTAAPSVAIPRSFDGLNKSFGARLATRSTSAFCKPVTGVSLSQSARRFVVSASKEAPLVGNVAPDFEAEAVFDQEFVKIKLSEYIGKKYVVLFFYPLDFTFVCPTEITAFSDKHAEFEKLNTEVIGVSTDSVFSHLAWIQTDRKAGGLGDLNYPLVSDLTKKISKDFGVLIPDQGIALRGLFIIDKEGVIQHATINNLAIGRSVEETLRTLQAVQYVQENPDEVCPAGWKPGEKTMKPDSKLSKEYFAAI
ncbi:peroxiredoxin 2/4 [Marchantia polymorpha subsp. ruderalis]|uniref:thioredoxin-dependent peroxiredoxin n=2 Tax=Marchantia polymorpha TaxID=3197 RepID=A0A176WJS1_MARPO|nr:hypothetical protein AXG93_3822s1160 [Marchantia polymorpha subsp. ruderalis]PTQ45503.1 hypothetical protein MARPO_0014s0048 [Marchantia polymorpha]BBM98219.1 hypothetical protein Mp_1g11790 [Marchantia polymorpha subsp. ruderalis]|eukprot:PTQ45503.1 hypothetical protein MARPO_0014s0048 [Marchantia polymorpha]